MSVDWNAVGALAALATLGVAGLGFAGGWAVSRKTGEDADKSARKAHERIDALTGRVADFRAEVAREYASKAALEQMEGRVVDAITRLGDRLDRFLERFSHGGAS